MRDFAGWIVLFSLPRRVFSSLGVEARRPGAAAGGVGGSESRMLHAYAAVLRAIRAICLFCSADGVPIQLKPKTRPT